MVSWWDEYAASTRWAPWWRKDFVSLAFSLVVDFISPIVSSVAVGTKQGDSQVESTEPNHDAPYVQLNLFNGMQRKYGQKNPFRGGIEKDASIRDGAQGRMCKNIYLVRPSQP
jgi:hypothetical protein